MIAAASHSAVRPSDLTVEQLSTSSVISEQEKVAELARQFESIMLRQMLRDARKPMTDGIMDDASNETKTYNDMVTDRMADAMSLGGGLGVASSLQAQLVRQLPHSGAQTGSAKDAPQK